jgi:hypothetical protein
VSELTADDDDDDDDELEDDLEDADEAAGAFSPCGLSLGGRPPTRPGLDDDSRAAAAAVPADCRDATGGGDDDDGEAAAGVGEAAEELCGVGVVGGSDAAIAAEPARTARKGETADFQSPVSSPVPPLWGVGGR